jgi:hypothetical protein
VLNVERTASSFRASNNLSSKALHLTRVSASESLRRCLNVHRASSPSATRGR